MSTNSSEVTSDSSSNTPEANPEAMSDEQKRRLRAVRRGYRAEKVELKDNGWLLEVTYLDGTKIQVNSKLLKLKASNFQE